MYRGCTYVAEQIVDGFFMSLVSAARVPFVNLVLIHPRQRRQKRSILPITFSTAVVSCLGVSNHLYVVCRGRSRGSRLWCHGTVLALTDI
ncbi:hypothetical protein QR685DRAFT_528153 [Neurospora intermedia]|uniref:Uncharacterized protein n=1 Tax=Neurospora intermedia TaxID=5142 RepID=A0ABR3DBD0_NEUIN